MTKIIPQGSPASAEDVSGLLRIWMLWYALSAMPLIDLIALSADELAALVRDWGWPRYRTRQILRWLYQARITDIAAMTDLSHADRTRLVVPTQEDPLGGLERVTFGTEGILPDLARAPFGRDRRDADRPDCRGSGGG